MGADWIQLFDKKLCDEIVGLNTHTLPAFGERNLDGCKEFSRFGYDFEGMPMADRLRRLVDDGESEVKLKTLLVDELCFSERKLDLDYWGCYAEVFRGVDPPGAIPDYRIFRDLRQQGFLLLLPDHVDLIPESLNLHRAEVTRMTEAD
jgi:hypothetical protein